MDGGILEIGMTHWWNDGEWEDEQHTGDINYTVLDNNRIEFTNIDFFYGGFFEGTWTR
jgi:hypothetical protein